MQLNQGFISLRGVRVHNLKNISVDFPRGALVVFTGVSGSGKSSLAFDTLYAEGQRRYMESLSTYARQFLNLMPKPNCDEILGLSPAIAIDQKGRMHNPRSTVGTVTEIYDYFRVLYARLGTLYSPITGEAFIPMSAPQINEQIQKNCLNKRIYILAPILLSGVKTLSDALGPLKSAGFQRIQLNDIFYEWEDAPMLPLKKVHTLAVVVDRCIVRAELNKRLSDSIETALQWGKGKVALYDCETHHINTYSSSYNGPESDFFSKKIEPSFFSFNNPQGACPDCKGIGIHSFFSTSLIVPDPSKSLLEGAIKPWAKLGQDGIRRVFGRVVERLHISLTAPFGTFSPPIQKIFLEGEQKLFSGVIPHLERQWKKTESTWLKEELALYREECVCTTCNGARLRKEALYIKIAHKSIVEISNLSIAEVHRFIQTLSFEGDKKAIAHPLLSAITDRLQFLKDVGLDYLTLNRAAHTLSGGESQRMRLASRIGTRLQGVLYILDEPSIGLHQRDSDRLIYTLKRLRDLGNTVVVVEHDEETIRAADYIVDLGPGAGKQGGEIVCSGTFADLQNCQESLTGAYLRDPQKIAIPSQRRLLSQQKCLQMQDVYIHNVHGINVTIPLGGFIGITGVSGSGKSSLILEALVPRLQKALSKKGEGEIKGYEHFDRVIEIDQSPIGRTPRSNPIIYIGGFSIIRELFASLPESKVRGYTAKHFSFNLKGGRCEVCQGDGFKRIEMHFLPDMFVTCDACKGRRYNSEILTIKFKGKSIADILEMSVSETIAFFRNFSVTASKLEMLQQVGLDYITIGQAATTLSGGEAQRIKLAKELSRRQNGKTLYVLDEPTTGLHFDDVRKLLMILQTLVDQGNTVIVIEHNLDVLKSTDWIIDLGPEGGEHGGKIVAQGTPEAISKVLLSHTGRYLAKIFETSSFPEN
ncbi:MAG: excinuclease ABC subunit UvrA [Holosporales bacterium]|jgi:excinuclease ABC subunit A|nr:excinuclease ABC subunit UvrA [Holosporales bacterium]